MEMIVIVGLLALGFLPGYASSMFILRVPTKEYNFKGLTYFLSALFGPYLVGVGIGKLFLLLSPADDKRIIFLVPIAILFGFFCHRTLYAIKIKSFKGYLGYKAPNNNK
jgi:hypothetical protein